MEKIIKYKIKRYKILKMIPAVNSASQKVINF